jgi:hypothetical protein
MSNTKPTQLHWITSSISAVPLDRIKSRREFMQKVALRRKWEPKRHHRNSRQLRIIILHPELGESTAIQRDNKISLQLEDCIDKCGNSDSDNVGPEDLELLTSLTQMRATATPYHSMLVKYNLDITDLSLLASHEVDRYTGKRRLEDPRNLAHFLGGKNWSFCRYIPLHYDQSSLVQNTTDCVLARVRCLLSPGQAECERLTISSYSKALSVLHEAINSASLFPSAEILCAT